MLSTVRCVLYMYFQRWKKEFLAQSAVDTIFPYMHVFFFQHDVSSKYGWVFFFFFQNPLFFMSLNVVSNTASKKKLFFQTRNKATPINACATCLGSGRSGMQDDDYSSRAEHE